MHAILLQQIAIFHSIYLYISALTASGAKSILVIASISEGAHFTRS